MASNDPLYKSRYRYACKEQIAKHQSKHRLIVIAKLWETAINFFGPCTCCGENRREFLAIDHIHGGGGEKRRNGEHFGYRLLMQFNHNNWPEELKKEYRLLCHNCNMSISRHGYCPHNPNFK